MCSKYENFSKHVIEAKSRRIGELENQVTEIRTFFSSSCSSVETNEQRMKVKCRTGSHTNGMSVF